MKSQPAIVECAFTAEDCYRFRCKCLHQGLSEKADGEKIHFTIPDKVRGTSAHMCVFNGHYQLQIDIFCLDVCSAADRWMTDVRAQPDIQRRMLGLIQVYDLSAWQSAIVSGH
jgi:hypothetical protein